LLRDFLLDHCAWLLARAVLPPVALPPAAPMWMHWNGMSPGDGMLAAPPYVEVEGGLLPWATRNIAESGLRTLVAFDGDSPEPLTSPRPDTAYVRVPIRIFGGFGPESRSSVATRHLRDFVREIVPASTVDVITRLDDDPKAFDVIGVVNDIAWRSDDSRINAAAAAPLLLLTASALAHRHAANVVAFATVDAGRGGWADDLLTRVWDELGLPAVLPRDPDARARSCACAIGVIGDRLRLHLAAMQGE
jgi:hypothetical protein